LQFTKRIDGEMPPDHVNCLGLLRGDHFDTRTIFDETLKTNSFVISRYVEVSSCRNRDDRFRSMMRMTALPEPRFPASRSLISAIAPDKGRCG
jgi:hypothetical protein